MINYYKGEFIEDKAITIAASANGFQYAYGVFTSLRTNMGKAVCLSAHLQRLKSNCQTIGISFPQVNYEEIIQVLIAKNNNQELRLKIIIFEEEINQASLLITASKFQAVYSPKSIKIMCHNYEASLLRGVKSLNYLENVFWHRKAIQANFDEALLLNSAQLICECSYANIFFVKDNKIYTPKVKNILNGIVRQKLISAFPIIEKDICQTEIETFEQVFTTNSVQGIVYVKRIDEVSFASNPIPELLKWERLNGFK
jgi:4-amino-4-deoxychorismate lyase